MAVPMTAPCPINSLKFYMKQRSLLDIRHQNYHSLSGFLQITEYSELPRFY